MTKIDRATIAAYVEAKGADRFRITRSGQLHIKGQMPNSIKSGWYFAGYAAEKLSDIKAGHA